LEERSKTAVIIGAGPAGLTAAYYLLKETDIRPVVLEELGETGGISRTVDYKGNRMDIGGHRFFSKSREVVDLWLSLAPKQGAPAKDDLALGVEKPLAENGPDPEKTDRVTLVRNRVSRIYFLRKFFQYPISLKLETIRNMGFYYTAKVGFGYLGARVAKRAEKSLEDFYINRFGAPLYQMFFEDYTEKLWGVHPSKISPEWGAQRVKGLSLFTAVKETVLKIFNKDFKTKETSLIEQFFYPKYGPGQLWEIMAEEVKKMGGEIRLNAKADRIDAADGRIVSVGVGSETIAADYFFSSAPVKDLIEAMGEAPPPIAREIARELPYRDFITVGLLMKKLKIKNETKTPTVNGIAPDCWIYIQERDVKIGRLQIFNNWSPYMLADFENTVWIGLEYFCAEGDEMWNMPDKDFIDFAISELEKIDVIDGADVLDSTRVRVKKAYPAYFGAYADFDTLRKYLDSFENLFCIGRNGQHRYNNMDHSALTAIEAVKLIKTGNKDKKSLWSVNAEEEYHETSKEVSKEISKESQ
jgi:protoporphyrinogen oxidase